AVFGRSWRLRRGGHHRAQVNVMRGEQRLQLFAFPLFQKTIARFDTHTRAAKKGGGVRTREVVLQLVQDCAPFAVAEHNQYAVTRAAHSHSAGCRFRRSYSFRVRSGESLWNHNSPYTST